MKLFPAQISAMHTVQQSSVVQSTGATCAGPALSSSCDNSPRKCHSRADPAVAGVTHGHTVNMEQARDQVDQVTNIMRGNVDKIMERDGKLQDLENKAEQLQADSQQFQVRR